MTPPLILQLNCPQESVAANESTSTQIFRVMSITLTGLIDFMVPTSGPWAILNKSVSYIVNLAPILRWALPSGPPGCPPASSQEPPVRCRGPGGPGAAEIPIYGSYAMNAPVCCGVLVNSPCPLELLGSSLYQYL
ncbi:hypothetical protein DSO57_1005472 [Entomophthora muscae]|uniref:Uncharacterized protein n=1 Tax=Entomophthora muscae TaxID=34485 RepID=A0ACC2U5P4_9FUNG|nr:hypothetical protein DSO57_1005472 [Entomophthora muscae]